jgi:hypothetical protein
MNVVDVRKAVQHPLLLKLAQCIEMQVTVAFMPQSTITTRMSGETDGMPNLDPEKIHAVCRAMNSGN